jgi:plastocyanin
MTHPRGARLRTDGMRTHLIALTAVAVLLLAACSPGAEEAGTDQTAATATEAPAESAAEPDDEGAETEVAGGEETVQISDFVFDPETLEVPVGTTVEWVQLDSSRHTVDFEDGEESGDLEEGDTYRRTFDEPGEHPYICFFHPRMTATVVVTG